MCQNSFSRFSRFDTLMNYPVLSDHGSIWTHSYRTVQMCQRPKSLILEKSEESKKCLTYLHENFRTVEFWGSTYDTKLFYCEI